MKYKDDLKSLMADRRERLAAAAFDLSEMLPLILANRFGTSGSIRISVPDYPLDFRGTEAAQVLQRELEDKGLEVHWEPHDGDVNSGLCDMVVSWNAEDQYLEEDDLPAGVWRVAS